MACPCPTASPTYIWGSNNNNNNFEFLKAFDVYFRARSNREEEAGIITFLKHIFLVLWDLLYRFLWFFGIPLATPPIIWTVELGQNVVLVGTVIGIIATSAVLSCIAFVNMVGHFKLLIQQKRKRKKLYEYNSNFVQSSYTRKRCRIYDTWLSVTDLVFDSKYGNVSIRRSNVVEQLRHLVKGVNVALLPLTFKFDREDVDAYFRATSEILDKYTSTSYPKARASDLHSWITRKADKKGDGIRLKKAVFVGDLARHLGSVYWDVNDKTNRRMKFEHTVNNKFAVGTITQIGKSQEYCLDLEWKNRRSLEEGEWEKDLDNTIHDMFISSKPKKKKGARLSKLGNYEEMIPIPPSPPDSPNHPANSAPSPFAAFSSSLRPGGTNLRGGTKRLIRVSRRNCKGGVPKSGQCSEICSIKK